MRARQDFEAALLQERHFRGGGCRAGSLEAEFTGVRWDDFGVL
ncbi:hypothetical protein [Kitasatospora sp. NE20-6]